MPNAPFPYFSPQRDADEHHDSGDCFKESRSVGGSLSGPKSVPPTSQEGPL